MDPSSWAALTPWLNPWSFALYVIALATQIDEQELVWLQKYAEAIDSLTGRGVAFVLFFNSLKFKTKDQPEGSTENVRPDIPAYVTAQWTEFARSMTYESDRVARCLQIHPSDLPCLVLIDDPGSPEFHIQPLMGTEEFILQLRRMIGDFYTSPGCDKYVRELERWDTAQSEVNLLAKEKAEVETKQAKLDPTIFKMYYEKRLEQLPKIEERLCAATDHLKGVSSILANMSRPRIGPILRKMKCGERRRSVVNAIAAAEGFVQDNAEGALKAIELVLKAQGNLT